MAFRRKPPVERLDDDSWIVRLQADEQEVLSHIMNQLDELVENAQTGSESALVDRLFPPAFTHHDAQHEQLDEEYQRLMRDELITARRTAISEVLSTFDSAEGGNITMSHGQLSALLQTLNA
ncbi:MAG: DUF2017 family protein, partial [Actinomycetota bacterium]